MENSLEKFRVEVSNAGMTGFKVGEINDIYEIAKLYEKTIEIKNTVNNLRPTVNNYIIDLAIDNLVSNNNKETKDRLIVNDCDNKDITVKKTDSSIA